MRFVVPLVQELLPCPNPWEVARRFADWPHLLFLDSADRHFERGRYSFISADPCRWQQERTENLGTDLFQSLAQEIAPFALPTLADLPPFQGGWAGMFGYGLARCLEGIKSPHRDEFGCPDLAVGLYDWVIAFDHAVDRAWLISTGVPAPGPSRAAERLEQVLEQLRQPIPNPSWETTGWLSSSGLAPQYPLTATPGVTTNFNESTYIDTIARAVEYIHAGDCFQVNVSQRLLAPQTLPPLELYGKLRDCNPAPFAGYLDMGEFAIASASPERFLRSVDGIVETRPIKGTRPRGRTPEADRALRDDLANSSKDRAENVMIVDLLRNDLGRVCKYRSVQVPRLCEIETYPFVHHLVSTVVGRLRDGTTPFDLLRASFPGGSVTGAPKVRAMQIIAELEPTARGPYCGSLGYFGFNGTMDTNILIRTFTAGRGWVQFPVGGGIVADSDPQREYEETLHKAAGMLRAL